MDPSGLRVGAGFNEDELFTNEWCDHEAVRRNSSDRITW